MPKSQIGEFAETEALRLGLSRVLKEAAIRHEGSLIILCGDFNTDPDSYKNNSAVQPALIDIGDQSSRTYMASGSLGITGRRDLVYSDVWYSPFMDGENGMTNQEPAISEVPGITMTNFWVMVYCLMVWVGSMPQVR